jgi:hypothetical protein
MRLRYRHELTELEIEGALALPAELGSAWTPQARGAGVLELFGQAVLGVVKVAVFAVGLTVRIVLPIAGELVCIALAAFGCSAGLLGRGLECAGRAAARRSWLITAGMDGLAQLPRSRRVEREQRTAIAVRVIR